MCGQYLHQLLPHLMVQVRVVVLRPADHILQHTGNYDAQPQFVFPSTNARIRIWVYNFV
jgi:hypothetical protein